MSLDPPFLLTCAITYTATLAWLFRVHYVATAARDALVQLSKELTRQIQALEDRLRRSEEAAPNVGRLAVSLDYLGEKFGRDLQHFSERQAEVQRFVIGQLLDVNKELSHVRANAAMARDLATRRTQASRSD